MKPRTEFVLGLHFHQPVGNFTHVLEEAYEKAYRPLLESFAKYDKLRLSLHISSPLLEYFRDKHPGFIKLIAAEIEKGKIEMLGGGFYEPVLISLPKRDVMGQLELTRRFYKKHFNTSFKGIWLTERVWEPQLPSLLKDTFVKYLAVDDTHFIQGGYLPENLRGYYVTEDSGNPLGIFPIRKELRYAIPFKPVDKILEVFKELSPKERNTPTLLCMLDDGEKFGLWPGTSEWVFEGGWLERFFSALEENAYWLLSSTLQEHFENNLPAERVYLPTTEYYEMLEWSMPVEGALRIKSIKEKLRVTDSLKEADPFFTGGIWRNYFARYPESNYMHKKMLYLSSLLEENSEKLSSEEYEKGAALLYQSQCNCPYWHGVFGGIYLNHLREAIFTSLNTLHKLLDKSLKDKNGFIAVSMEDIDADFNKEALIDTESLFAVIKPRGYFEELSDKKSGVNLLNTVMRRPELYHTEILEEIVTDSNTEVEDNDDGIASIHNIRKDTSEDLKERLIYDTWPRKTLSSLILPPNTEFKDYLKGNFERINSLNMSLKADLKGDTASVLSEERYTIAGRDFSVQKIIQFEKNLRGFNAKIKIRNLSDSETRLRFLTEFIFSMLSDNGEERSLFCGEKKIKLSDENERTGIQLFGALDKERKFKSTVQTDKPARLWSAPVYAVVNSLEGYELSYIFSSMSPVWDIHLKGGEEEVIQLSFSTESL